MPNELAIRPARADDQPAVFAMVAGVWGGTDYLPFVWHDWLADAANPLLVGEVGSRVVAVARLTTAAPGQEWFEGLRVDPEMRGRGYARRMIAHLIALARERGGRVLRFSTGVDNATMHRAAAKLGFHLVYVASHYEAGLDGSAPAPLRLPPAQLPRLQEELAASPLLARSHGLYMFDWRAYELSPERLREHVERGEVVGLPGRGAWAIVLTVEDERWLAHASGSAGSLAALLLRVRARLGPAEPERVHAMLPADKSLQAALAAAGYTPGPHGVHLYELWLGAQPVSG